MWLRCKSQTHELQVGSRQAPSRFHFPTQGLPAMFKTTHPPQKFKIIKQNKTSKITLKTPKVLNTKTESQKGT